MLSLYCDGERGLMALLDEMDNFDADDYVHMYGSHMGGIYISERKIPFSDLQCLTCGDSDIWLMGGLFGELVAKFAKEFMNKYKDDIQSIGDVLLDNIDINGMIMDLTGEMSDMTSSTCPDSSESCPAYDVMDENLRELLLNTNIPLECRMCTLEEVLESMFRGDVI